MSIEGTLRDVATAAGLNGIGFCSADPFPEVQANIDAAVESGRSASLAFTFADAATAASPRASYPWARSMVVGTHTYLPGAGDPPPRRAGAGRVARFATEDHYVPLRAGLNLLGAALEATGYRAAVLCDDNRLVDRAAAVRAGVAWWGKSAMALTPGAGPWMLLGSVVTDAQLTPDEPMERDCGTCDACIPACPTGAIIAPGVVDARRCLAAITQSGGTIPLEFRGVMEDRIYGCDDCLAACPPGQRLAAAATIETGAVDLIDLLATADRPLRRRFAHFYIPRNQARFLRRNAIVALGNSMDPDYMGILAGLLGHPDEMLRVHASWAVGRVGGPSAAAILRAARIAEDSRDVVAEIDRALSTLA